MLFEIVSRPVLSCDIASPITTAHQHQPQPLPHEWIEFKWNTETTRRHLFKIPDLHLG